MFIKRVQEGAIQEGAKYFPVVAILGPRQSGKTTLARSMFVNHKYVTLEDLDVREAARHDPRSFMLANLSMQGIIIDEFQYVPELLSYIQTTVDEKKIPGQFVLTGSQNFLMSEAITQSLAGRVSIHTLLPLSIDELKLNNLLPGEVESLIFKGSYPAVYSEQVPPTLLYTNYVQTYLERDVRQLAHVGDLSLFRKFIRVCATRIGQEVNITALGNECDISDTTAKRWLSILEAGYVIFLLQPFHTSFGKRLIKSPKLYFYDTGLACSLLKIKEEDLDVHPSRGGLFESLIISDIIKWSYNHGNPPSVYFWRDQSGNEIDCIVEQGKRLIAIEIKAGRTVSPRYFKELSKWYEITGSQESGYVVYAGSDKQIRVHIKLLSWQSMGQMLANI